MKFKRNRYLYPKPVKKRNYLFFLEKAKVLNTFPPAQDLSDPPKGRLILRLIFLGLITLGIIYLASMSVNILVLGTDDVDYSQHTDTIMLAHWQPLPRRLALLSIPRDTLVRLPKRGPMKINAVYAYGSALGPHEYALGMTRAAVENILGLRMHFYIHMCYSEFIKLVDALGGVPMVVPEAMHYVDQAGGVNIHLEPGYQLLDGRQSLDYVRFRQDGQGDIGRIRRQQAFVKAFVLQLVRFSCWPRTVKAFYLFVKQVETNFNLLSALFLALEMKAVVGVAWKQSILPGRPVYIEGKSYWEPDPEAIRQRVANLGRPLRPQEPVEIKPAVPAAGLATDSERLVPAPRVQTESQPTPGAQLPALPSGPQPVVRVLNGCGVAGVGKIIASNLRAEKIQILDKDISNAPNFLFPQTIIKTNLKNLSWAKRIAAILKLDETRIQKIPPQIAYPTVTLVIGGDYQQWSK